MISMADFSCYDILLSLSMESSLGDHILGIEYIEISSFIMIGLAKTALGHCESTGHRKTRPCRGHQRAFFIYGTLFKQQARTVYV